VALESRRRYSQSRLESLRAELDECGTERRVDGRACVYLTGSFGRGEASPYSDVDLFLVGLGAGDERKLSRLDEICVKADLIQATRQLRFPDFSGDGEYLTCHGIGDLVDRLGAADDDARNTLTARLLLLLESRPLVGEDVYRTAIERVIASYWRDYQDHRDDFVPAFLATHVERGTVSPDDALEMVGRTPTERLEWLRGQRALGRSAGNVDAILAAYDAFLEETDAPEAVLVERFLDPERSRTYAWSASRLGDLVADLLESLGDGRRMFRLLLV